MSLRIPFDPSGLDPRVVGAFDDLIATLQTWANTNTGLFLPTLRTTIQAAQVIPTAVNTTVVWMNPSAIDSGDYNLAVNTGIVLDTSGKVFLTQGRYLIIANLDWALTSTVGARGVSIVSDGSGTGQQAIGGTFVPSGPTTAARIQAVAVVDVPSTQRYSIWAFQDSGGNLNLNANPKATWLQVTKLSN